jgi:hypothetical protein
MDKNYEGEEKGMNSLLYSIISYQWALSPDRLGAFFRIESSSYTGKPIK